MITQDIDARFDVALPAACERIGCKTIDLLGVMFSESGCRSSAHNQAPAKVLDKTTKVLRDSRPDERYNAVGLIQFMPAILPGVGWRNGYEAFKHLTASQQLPFVVAYFNAWKKTGAPFDSAGRLYQATFLPATLAKQRGDDEVLSARGGRLGWAYEANATFDANGDGKITIGELTEAIHRNARGPRWAELLGRMGIKLGVMKDGELEAALAGDDAKGKLDALLRSVRGLQLALVRLGYDIGKAGVDGFAGRDTRSAVMAFQNASNLGPDGRVGPITRGALVEALLSPKTESNNGE